MFSFWIVLWEKEARTHYENTRQVIFTEIYTYSW